MIERKYWKGGYLQTGNGDEITIITRNEEGKRIDRLIFNASELDNIINELNLCQSKAMPKIQGHIF